MNEIKAFIDDEGKAVITCPECQAVRIVDVTGYAKLDHVVRFRVRCPCNHSYRVILERRKYFRKSVSLTGVCLFRNGMVRVSVKVRNLSRRGLRVELMREMHVGVGDKVIVEFRLDDEKRTLVRKDAVVRAVMGSCLGMEFFSIDPYNVYDKALGFYLM